MRPRAVKSDCSSVSMANRQLLVLGYQGTLGPDSDVCDVAGPTRDATRNGHATGEISTPWMEAAIEPLLTEAVKQLGSRVPAARRMFGGAPIPSDSLVCILRDRLRGILTQAMAACSETIDPFRLTSSNELVRIFPVLSQLVKRAVVEWAEAAAVFHNRLHQDGSRLAGWLGVDAMPPIESVCGAASDLHPGGHIVLRVAFTGGRCLYYKPRPVSGEWLWHRLLAHLAEAEPALCLPAARVLPGSNAGRYGWAQSVLPWESDSQERQSATEWSSATTAAYWHAAGAMLCLAQQVRLTDLHLGNMLATPSGPAVTDAECFGTPEVAARSGLSNASDDPETGAMVDSFLDTGLLPGQSEPGIPDTSGLFGGAGSTPGFGLPRWESMPDGRYRMTLVPAALLDHGNTPRRTSAVAVLPRMMSGYRQAAEVLTATRKTLVSPGSLWRSVLEKEHGPRMVLRKTLTYGILLSESLEPSCLHSEHKRRRAILAALERAAPGNLPKALLRTESEALVHLHVPRFVILPGTRTLANGSGRSIRPSFALCTPVAAIMRRMESLSPENLEATHLPALLLTVLNNRRSARTEWA